ncbi:MAG: hypothetical protein ABFC77_11990 [Thermoguttaceae bacterium]
MGDNLLEGQVKNSRKRRDRAMTEMQLPSLLYRPELVRQVFTVKPVDGALFEEGEVLLAVRTGDGASIDVTRDYDRIGVIEGEAARVLGKALIDTGVARLRIGEVLSLSGAGKAEIVME